MATEKQQCVDVIIDEIDGDTRAEARLRTGPDTDLVGVGWARVSPVDRDVPEIGDELAIARALTDLGHRLLIVAAGDIAAVTAATARVRG